MGRVGDPISCGGTVAKGDSFFIIGNGNEKALNKAGYELKKTVTRHTRRKEDDIFFCLPLIADAMGNKANEKDRIGWHYLRDMFYKWLAGEANDVPSNNPSPFWVDIDWILSYPKAKEAWKKVTYNYLTKKEALIELGKYLEELGIIAEKRIEFDFINIPFSEWNKYHYQHISVDFSYKEMGDYAIKKNGLFAAMGSFTFKFRAKGKIIYYEKGYDIIIEQVVCFVHDVFNFENYWILLDFLGYWSCEEKEVRTVSFDGAIRLHDKTFRDFRERNKIGNDFTVLSKSKYIDLINDIL